MAKCKLSVCMIVMLFAVVVITNVSAEKTQPTTPHPLPPLPVAPYRPAPFTPATDHPAGPLMMDRNNKPDEDNQELTISIHREPNKKEPGCGRCGHQQQQQQQQQQRGHNKQQRGQQQQRGHQQQQGHQQEQGDKENRLPQTGITHSSNKHHQEKQQEGQEDNVPCDRQIDQEWDNKDTFNGDGSVNNGQDDGSANEDLGKAAESSVINVPRQGPMIGFVAKGLKKKTYVGSEKLANGTWINTNEALEWVNVTLNNGNGFLSNGTFVAPLDGTYQFSVQVDGYYNKVISPYSPPYFGLQLGVREAGEKPTYYPSGDRVTQFFRERDPVSMTAMIYLKSFQHVTARVVYYSELKVQYEQQDLNRFEGRLLLFP